MVDMIEVRSTNIRAIGWEADEDEASDVEGAKLPTGKLTVQFGTGFTYEYEEVPEEVFMALRDAESVGRYFIAHVRDTFLGSRV